MNFPDNTFNPHGSWTHGDGFVVSNYAEPEVKLARLTAHDLRNLATALESFDAATDNLVFPESMSLGWRGELNDEETEAQLVTAVYDRDAGCYMVELV